LYVLTLVIALLLADSYVCHC